MTEFTAINKPSDLASRVLAATPDHISVVGADYRYRFVNAAYELAHGLSQSDIIGMSVSSLLGSEVFTSKVRPALDRCLAGEEMAYEAWFEFEGAGSRYMAVRYLPIRTSTGQVEEVLVLSNDITVRKVAEQALERSEAKYRGYIARAPHAVFVVDEQGSYQEVNPAAWRMTGYDEAELLDKSIIDLVPEVDRMEVLEGFATLLRDGVLRTRMRLKTKQAGPIPVSLVAARIAPQRYIGFCEDLSGAIEMERQLRQAQKMEALGLLAGGIAHDFNNLLTAILGYTDVLANRVTASPEREYLTEIQKVTERASELTRQLLTFSQPTPLPVQSVDVNAVVLALRQMLIRLIGEPYRVETQLSTALPAVSCTRNGLEQVIVNLVVNARDAMPEGGRLTISTSAVQVDPEIAASNDLAPGPFVAVAVAGEGVGITDEVRSRMFEPFFTTKAPGQGTGLGLSVTYGIIRAFGGDISAHCPQDGGTRVRVLLPCVAR